MNDVIDIQDMSFSYMTSNKRIRYITYCTAIINYLERHLALYGNNKKQLQWQLDINTVKTYRNILLDGVNVVINKIEENEDEKVYKGIRKYREKYTSKRVKSSNEDPVLADIVQRLRMAGIIGRINGYTYRLFEELTYAITHNYGILFATLTVDDTDYHKVFNINSPYWASYIQRLRRMSEKQHGKKPYHSYFAVTERGDVSGRLHIHCLHVFERLFLACSNSQNVFLPERRSVQELSTSWPHGFSQHIPVRIEPGDYWGEECGHIWPTEPARSGGNRQIDIQNTGGMPTGRENVKTGMVETNLNEPIRGGTPVKLCRYMIKYLTKSYQSDTPRHWRTKVTNKYGVRYLREAIDNLPTNQIVRILCRNPINLTLRNGLTIPASLTKTQAHQIVASRLTPTQTLALPPQKDLKSLVKDVKMGGKYRDLMSFGTESLNVETTASDNKEVITHILTYLHERLHITMEDLSYGNAQ